MSEDTLFQIAQFQAGLWTFIDAACVGLVVAIIDELRLWKNRPRAISRWILIAGSLCAYPLVLGADTRREFFKMEAIVVSLQFLALLACFFDIKLVFELESRLRQLSLRPEQDPRHTAQRIGPE